MGNQPVKVDPKGINTNNLIEICRGDETKQKTH